MIIQKDDEYFLIKIFKGDLKDFNFFDIDSIQDFFQDILDRLSKKYEVKGLLDVEVYVYESYGMIIEIRPIESYFDEIDMRIRMHLDNVFLIEIDSNCILDYEDVYYYKNKFYSTYLDTCDNEVIYKDTDEIIDRGIKIY